MELRTRTLSAAVCAWTLVLMPWNPASAVASPDRGRFGLEMRLSLGHDSNLLDLSDLERASFTSGGDSTFFAVDRLSDQFFQGELEVEWRSPRAIAGRPRIRLGWERRQYLHNAIKSEDHLLMGLQVQPRSGTRLDLEAGFRPQVYGQHRFDRDALPGEAQFRPEVRRRWDLDVTVEQALGRRSSVEMIFEGSTRRYQAPFQERDRESFGVGCQLSRSLGENVNVSAGLRRRATWTRNEPWDPDDRSHRVWRASTEIRFRNLSLVQGLRLGLDLEWRQFTSNNPDDEDHFGRQDLGGEAQVETVRGISSSLDWVTRATRRWSDSDFPTDVLDEDGPSQETVLRTGVVWQWEQP
jgi:hypothetical protein